MTAGPLLLACLCDAVLGDPRWFPHPVRLMGWVVGWIDGHVRRATASPVVRRVAGCCLAIGLPLGVWELAATAIDLAGRVHATVGTAAGILLAWTTLAARDLIDHALAVRRALDAGSLADARAAVSQIVGRDTAQLDEPEIVRATVETIAESTCDGVVAPLVCLAIGGAPLALAYKAVSTLDSMIGHKDERHRDVGWASARLDDVVNWLPARLTGLLLVTSACVIGLGRGQGIGTARAAWKIFLRDGAKHPSPNSGRPEAAMAGALGVRLGGVNWYGGMPDARPTLGDPLNPLTPGHIGRALGLMATASILAACGAAVLGTMGAGLS